MKPSPAFTYPQEQGINSRTFIDPNELLLALHVGRLDVVVGDDTVLRYNIRKA